MTVNVKVERSGRAILDGLREASPSEAATFEAEYSAALRRAAATFDLSESEQLESVVGDCASAVEPTD